MSQQIVEIVKSFFGPDVAEVQVESSERGTRVLLYTDAPRAVNQQDKIKALKDLVWSSASVSIKVDVKKLKSKKILTYHPQTYLAKTIASAIGFTPAEYTVFDSPDTLAKQLDETVTHLLLCDDHPLEAAKIMATAIMSRDNAPIIVLLTYRNNDALKRCFQKFMPELGACIDIGLLHVCRLPERLRNIKEKFTGRIAETPPDAKEIRTAMSLRLAKAQDEALRHSLGNRIAAARILNGALLSGDYCLLDLNEGDSERQRFTRAYRDMMEGDSVAEIEKGQRIENLDRLLQTAEKWPRNAHRKSKPGWYKGIGRTLIIDDEVATWRPVWNFLLNGNFDIFGDVDKDWDRIVKAINTQDYHCLLLDLNLQASKHGLDLIQEIKALRFDLPVIMMTASDHSELTRLCLQYGAESYYVKELRDIRDSLPSYHYLRELLLSIPPYRSDAKRQIWKHFAAMEKPINAVDSSCHTEIAAFFKKAYYFLSLNENHLFPSELLTAPRRGGTSGDHAGPESSPQSPERVSSRYDGVALNAVLAAVEVLVAKCIQAGRFASHEQARKYLFSKTSPSSHRPSLAEMARRAFDENMAIDRLHSFSSVRHPEADPTSQAAAEEGMCELLKLIGCLQLPDDGPTCAVPVQRIDISKFPQPDAPWGSHQARSLTGSAHFAKGYQQKYGSGKAPISGLKTEHKVLFIDDEADSSPWFSPLADFFGTLGVGFEAAASYPHQPGPIEYSIILLDLKHKFDDKEEPEKGLYYLREIKQHDISVPVVMLTADNSSKSCRNCLLAGADSYFVKEANRGAQEYFEEFERIILDYLAQTDHTMRRKWVSCLKPLEQSHFGLNKNVLEQLLSNPEIEKKHYKSPAEAREHETHVLISYLKEMYFYYLLHINQQAFVDLWRVRRLLTHDGNGANDFYLCLGRFLEYLLRLLSYCNGFQEPMDGGFLINNIRGLSRDQRRCLNSLWKLRMNAKTAGAIAHDMTEALSLLSAFLGSFRFFVPAAKLESKTKGP